MSKRRNISALNRFRNFLVNNRVKVAMQCFKFFLQNLNYGLKLHKLPSSVLKQDNALQGKSVSLVNY